MNILVVGKFYMEGFALHIAETLVAMGHVVHRFEPEPEEGRSPGRIGHRWDQVRRAIYTTTDGIPAIRASRTRRLWKILQKGHLDVAIVCHDFLWPAEVVALKQRTGALVALWFPDALVNFGRAYFMNAPYDALFFKDPYIVHALDGVLGSPVYYLPECFNPARHTVSTTNDEDCDAYRCEITTAGNQHSYRVALFRHLEAYDVKLWGHPAPLWLDPGPVRQMYQGRAVLNEEKACAFRAAKIVVNNLSYAEVWGVNVRAFEVAGAGGFQLVDWRPGLAQLFEDGKELVSFVGMGDLKEKIDYYLAHEEKRMEIARAGKLRAEREHTYSHRLSLLLQTLMGQAHGLQMPDITYRTTQPPCW